MFVTVDWPELHKSTYLELSRTTGAESHGHGTRRYGNEGNQARNGDLLEPEGAVWVRSNSEETRLLNELSNNKPLCEMRPTSQHLLNDSNSELRYPIANLIRSREIE
ncbi:hypothetical protein J6590_053157 [Homalodisca vitripennis]|nr:hypothetical protein J6590_053157 [Homalodisca vitripennis]